MTSYKYHSIFFPPQFIAESEFREIENAVRKTLETYNIILTNDSMIFPTNDRVLPTASLKPLPEPSKATGASETFIKHSNACRSNDDEGTVTGIDPVATHYADVARLGLSIHELMHIIQNALFPDTIPRGKQEAGLTQDWAAENKADIGAAIFLLNRYPNNARITEYLNLRSLWRHANAYGEGGFAHDSSQTTDLLLSSSSGWQHTSGTNISVVEAFLIANQFVDSHLDLKVTANNERKTNLNQVVEGMEVAQKRLCTAGGAYAPPR
jgi:hypothetical protein